MIQMYGTSIDQ